MGEFLRKKGFSRHILTEVRRSGERIRKNGEPVWMSTVLEAGDEITVTLPQEQSSEQIVPRKIAFEIVYEDEDLMVIHKGADIPVHPSINNFENTLANGLAWYFQEKGEPFVFRCINRLDRDTTGLLIVAKHMLSAGILSEQGKRREIHRKYLAVVSGELPAEGTVDAPIARKEESVIERCVDHERGERAVTHYRRLAFCGGYSLVLLQLETGRTHQIRVHMKHIGHPLIGDFLYNPDCRLIDHQALHSFCLSFRHPITGEEMHFVREPDWSCITERAPELGMFREKWEEEMQQWKNACVQNPVSQKI